MTFNHRFSTKHGVVALAIMCALAPPARPARADRAPQEALSADTVGLVGRGSLSVDSLERRFLYYVPPEHGSGAPLVLAFHGSGGDGARIRHFIGASLERFADEHGFVVVYPDGFGGNWNDCRGRAPFTANRRRIDDVAFVRALVDRFRRADGVDPTQVYAVGYSNGGHMAYRLALEVPGAIRAVAAVGANLPVPEELDCCPCGEAVSVLVVNGTADEINPYDGGEVTLPDGRSFGRVRSAEGTVGYFARLAGYRDGLVAAEILGEADGLSVERTAWERPGAPRVALYTVHGGGHTIPGSPAAFPPYLGAIERRFDAVQEAVRFFLSESAAPERPALRPIR